ncbi:unnamed protein product [Ranitomeya imitator]|uniref:Uncharacterized protein n=1 Tax=Ranitomeya imitator TaxID=111125 RepID=A0ABN9L3Z5_9NEOB|nr:unnamed protein product [Ranitomeya imitator]
MEAGTVHHPCAWMLMNAQLDRIAINMPHAQIPMALTFAPVYCHTLVMEKHVQNQWNVKFLVG